MDNGFEEWWDKKAHEWCGSMTVAYSAAKAAWEHQEKRVRELEEKLERLRSFECHSSNCGQISEPFFTEVFKEQNHE